jgi:DNA-binding PadR family transcriptional regulator
MFRYVVLGLLRDGVKHHGYALMKRYRQRTGLSINTGSFYRELQRLVSEGLIESTAPSSAEAADVRRTPYVITEAGKRAFDTWFASPVPLEPTQSGEDQLAARMLFLTEAPHPIALEVLQAWQDTLWTRATAIDRAREVAKATPVADGFDVLSYLLARRLRHVAVDIEMVDELRRAYQTWRDRAPGQTGS